MPIEIKPVNASWAIVDTGVPGWKTLESHASRERAERRLAILTGSVVKARRPEPGSAPTPPSDLSSASEPQDDPVLVDLLSGSVRDVKDRLQRVTDADTLTALLDIERRHSGRNTVMKAIKALLRAA